MLWIGLYLLQLFLCWLMQRALWRQLDDFGRQTTPMDMLIGFSFIPVIGLLVVAIIVATELAGKHPVNFDRFYRLPPR